MGDRRAGEVNRSFIHSFHNLHRLGHGDTHDCLVPTEVSLLSQERPLFIAAGESHSACINAHYQLFTWGGGIHGRLGHGVEGNEHQPKMVEDLMDEKIVFVSCGVFHTLCLNKDGVIFAFGEGKYGKLGISVDKDSKFISGENFIFL
jgi:RCC1 and BTB domain-containing protein